MPEFFKNFACSFCSAVSSVLRKCYNQNPSFALAGRSKKGFFKKKKKRKHKGALRGPYGRNPEMVPVRLVNLKRRAPVTKVLFLCWAVTKNKM